MRFDEYVRHDAVSLAQLLARGEVTATELLDIAWRRMEEVNPAINAVVRTMRPQAEQAIRDLPSRPTDDGFAGVPFLLKDLICGFAGVPMENGSRACRGMIPKGDAEYVARIKAAGLVTFGKTNTPEFGITPATDPELTGSARNPWNLQHSPGGSSGGAAAAVAAGVVPMASASDGGGSIRIPASCCGLFGLKPTRGRVPSGPHQADGWYGAIAELAVSWSVRDSARMLDRLQGPYPGQLLRLAPPEGSYESLIQRPAEGLTIAYSTDAALGESLDPECKAAVLATVRQLEALGHRCEEVSLPIDREEFIYAYSVLVCAEMAATRRSLEIELGRRLGPADFEARSWATIQLGSIFTAADVSLAVATLHQFSRQWMTRFDRYDALLTSTLGTPPVRVGELCPTTAELFEVKALRFLPIGWLAKQKSFVVKSGRRIFNFASQTMPANVTGQPSMSVPLHTSRSCLPIGMMFTGRWGEEGTLLRLAAQLEQAHPWKDRRPSI